MSQQLVTTSDYSRSDSNDYGSFHMFPLLPKEIRMKIWEEPLQRERMIEVELRSNTAVTDRHNPDNLFTAGGEHYDAIVNGHRAISKLLHINHESRETALKFYRVHIRDTAQNDEPKPGFFFFNPERDFIYIKPGWLTENYLIDFLCDLKFKYDPRHIGLLKLAVDLGSLDGQDFFSILPSKVDSSNRSMT